MERECVTVQSFTRVCHVICTELSIILVVPIARDIIKEDFQNNLVQ